MYTVYIVVDTVYVAEDTDYAAEEPYIFPDWPEIVSKWPAAKFGEFVIFLWGNEIIIGSATFLAIMMITGL